MTYLSANSSTMNTERRLYDIVIYGATGFTGQLVAEYFAAHVDPAEVRWAVSGRNRAKLMEVKSRIEAAFPNASKAGWILADSNDPDSLKELCSSTRILLTTIGPYAHYGEPLVKACVENGTHYLDITGEPEFVQNMLNKYDASARKNNVLIINCCGFDSIPADAGAFFTASQLSQGPKSVQGYVSAKGTFSGGTWASAINAFSKLSEGGLPKGSGAGKSSGKAMPSFHYNKETEKWAAPMPVIDPWMVKRSSQVRPEVYGEGFRYAQYIGLKSLPTMGALLLGVGALVAASQLEFSRKLLLDYRKSGDGPSAEERANGFFKLSFVGRGGSEKVVCSVSGGDPGYTETAKMLSESALTLMKHYEDLPYKGGVLTPAGALGQHLIDRLMAAGIQFKREV